MRALLGLLVACALAWPGKATALAVPEFYQPLMALFWQPEQVPTLVRIIGCESGWDRFAVEPTSGAAGLTQVMPGTWEDARVRLGSVAAPFHEGWHNPAQQLYTARVLYEERGWGPWEASRFCWEQ